MRATAASIAATAALLVLASSSSAAPHVTLHASFSPDRAGASTTIHYGFTISEPAPLRSMQLRLPAGMGFATSSLGLAECTTTPLLEDGVEGCSPNAQIGFGNGLAEVPFIERGRERMLKEPLSVTELLGPPEQAGLDVLVYVEGIYPVVVERILTARLRPGPRPFGATLTITAPAMRAWDEGPYVGITRFTSTIGPHGLRYVREEHGHKIVFQPRGLTVPAKCPAHGYLIEARFTWWNAPAVAARRHISCPRSQRLRRGRRQ